MSRDTHKVKVWDSTTGHNRIESYNDDEPGIGMIRNAGIFSLGCIETVRQSGNASVRDVWRQAAGKRSARTKR